MLIQSATLTTSAVPAPALTALFHTFLLFTHCSLTRLHLQLFVSDPYTSFHELRIISPVFLRASLQLVAYPRSLSPTPKPTKIRTHSAPRGPYSIKGTSSSLRAAPNRRRRRPCPETWSRSGDKLLLLPLIHRQSTSFEAQRGDVLKISSPLIVTKKPPANTKVRALMTTARIQLFQAAATI